MAHRSLQGTVHVSGDAVVAALIREVRAVEEGEA